MNLNKQSFEELCQMIDSFVGSSEFDIEKARIFVENSLPNNTPAFSYLAYPLTRICFDALKVNEYELAAKAYQKAYELAPSTEEVEWVTQTFSINYLEIKNIEVLTKRMKTMNNEIKVDYWKQ